MSFISCSNDFFFTLQNFLKDFLVPAPLVTLSVLNLTVLERGRHSPTVATSPTDTSLKQGDKCTETFLCRFSKRLYFLT